MAVNQDKDKSGQQGSMGAAYESAQGRTNNSQQQGKSSFSFRSMGSGSRAAMSRSPASESLSKLHKAMNVVYEENVDKSFETSTIPVDMNNTTSLNVSVLIVAVRDKNAPQLGVAFHTLIVEASTEAPAPRFENIGGQNVEIPRPISDAYDQTMVNVVLEQVGRQYPQTTLLNAGSCVVPRDFNVNDTQLMYKLAANAVFACSQELETADPAFNDLNLSQAERDSMLTVRTTFGNPQQYDAVGKPVRAEVLIDFSAAASNQNQNQGGQQGIERVTPVSQIGGFLDLVWNPVMAEQTMGYYQPQGPQSSQKYSVRFVSTVLESHQLLTIPAQLLALVPALALDENNNWVHGFRPQSFSSDIDMHDIGAIGIEVPLVAGNPNPTGRIDTRSDSFKPEHLGQLISASIRPGLTISIDVPECGPQTWYNGVFAAAAVGNMNANNAIIEAANHLTNGHFGQFYNGNGMIAIQDNNRIQLGSYTDRSGVKRDIRDIDYLAVLNLVGEKDPAIIRTWSDSFLATNRPLAARLADRKRIIQGMFSDVEFNGYAVRVTLEVAFLDALAKGIHACGLVTRSTSQFADMGSFERATGSFTSHTSLSGASTGLFNRPGFGGAQQGANLGRGFTGFGAGRNWN